MDNHLPLPALLFYPNISLEPKSFEFELFNQFISYFLIKKTAGIIFSWGLQLRVLLEIAKLHLHKSVLGAGISRDAGIIRGRVLYEEIRYIKLATLYVALEN